MIPSRGKITVAMVACAAFVLGNVPVIAAPAASHGTPTTLAESPAPQGVKSKAVVRAVMLVATGIRKGNKYLGTILKNLDKAAVAPFLKHSDKIADLLDDIAKIPDLALSVVRERLFQMLSNPRGSFKIEYGLAKDITEEIVGVINALI